MENFRIELDDSTIIHFPGNKVKGRVVCQNKEPVKARDLTVYIYGVANTNWSEQTTKGKVNLHGHFKVVPKTESFSSSVVFIHECRIVWSAKADETKIPAGFNSFPFSFDLPANCAPSFPGGFGTISYNLKVQMDRTWKFNKTVEKKLDVFPMCDLNTIPRAMNPIRVEKSQNTGMLVKRGEVTVVAELPKHGYVYGENVPITLLIDNDSTKPVCKVSVKLCRLSQYQASSGKSEFKPDDKWVDRHSNHDKRSIDITLEKEKKHLEIKPHSKEKVEFSLKIPFIPIEFECPIIKSSCYISVKVDTTTTFKNSLLFYIPLIIGTIPIRK